MSLLSSQSVCTDVHSDNVIVRHIALSASFLPVTTKNLLTGQELLIAITSAENFSRIFSEMRQT